VSTTGTSFLAIIYEPILVVADANRVFLEIHADAYRRLANPFVSTVQLFANVGAKELATGERVRVAVQRRAGPAEEIGTLPGSTFPVPTAGTGP
jgi:hypothetical protein